MYGLTCTIAGLLCRCLWGPCPCTPRAPKRARTTTLRGTRLNASRFSRNLYLLLFQTLPHSSTRNISKIFSAPDSHHITPHSEVNMDRGTVASLHVFPREEADQTNLQVQKQLEAFILDFRLDNLFVYRYGACFSTLLSHLAYFQTAEISFVRTPYCKSSTAISTLAT